jgi:hypothetical protein
MSAETTPYVRAIEAAAGTYSTPEGVADAVLTAALSDPDDPDSLARTLFVLYHGAGGAPAETALMWWDNETRSRTRWHRVAASLRMTLTGGAP